jgi:nicotinate-nucleotide adenylyltransferase
MSEPSLPPALARRVAFFGGSFDPPHLGHLAVARAALSALDLDSVLFAPVGAQPLKPLGSSASYQDRLAMTRLAIADNPDFAISLADAPKPSGEPNYTFETLLALRSEISSDGALFCLMGADSFVGLRRWHRAAEIPFVAPLIVAARPGELLQEIEAALPEGLMLDPQAKPRLCPSCMTSVNVLTYVLSNPAGDRTPFFLLPDLQIEISATQIREQVRADSGSQHDALLPESVSAYIRAHDLYRY